MRLKNEAQVYSLSPLTKLMQFPGAGVGGGAVRGRRDFSPLCLLLRLFFSLNDEPFTSLKVIF